MGLLPQVELHRANIGTAIGSQKSLSDYLLVRIQKRQSRLPLPRCAKLRRDRLIDVFAESCCIEWSMLRITETRSAAQAKSYYSTSDYYTEGQELPGRWRGQAAARLGLGETIDPADWDKLCDNRHPQTGESLTLRQKENRRVAYDMNFHVPKSYSVLFGLTEDARLLDAFRESVRETMDEMESEMKTRVRKGGRNEDRVTGSMVWGEFVHTTSRPVDGVPDPHLHSHCVVFNATWDANEESWKAGQFGDLKRDAQFFESRFHLRLTHKLAQMGIAAERNQKGWEIAGVGRSLIEKFSRRTEQIERAAQKNGVSDPREKSELGAKTRERKAKHLTLEALRADWIARLTDEERDSLLHINRTLGREALPESPEQIQDQVRNAADHVFERKSVVPERTLIAEAMKRSVGLGTIEAVEQAHREYGFLTKGRRGVTMATTRDVLAEEQSMLDFARQGRGNVRPLKIGPNAFSREWLNDDQRRAVTHVLQSPDRVLIVRGAAGVGKTSMMQEAVEGIEAGGKQVFVFAPTARASRSVLRQQGFEQADTLARLLQDTSLHTKVRDQVIWVDEAGLVGSRTMAALFLLAEKQNARVVLSGDRYQHGSVERGSALRLLETDAGLRPAEIREILRQKDRYRQVVRNLSEGDVATGFRQLDAMGWVREIPDEERYQTLADDYQASLSAGESALIVSPTHREAAKVTARIREQLKEAGQLGHEQRVIQTLRNANLTEAERADTTNYQPGDTLVFHQNAKGFTKGQRVKIGSDGPPVEQAARFQVFHQAELAVAAGDMLRVTQNGKTVDGKHRLHNGDLVKIRGFDEAGHIVTEKGWTIAKDFGHLAHGYVVTSHASQGTDVDHVLIAQSTDSFPASSREQLYVSVSRGKRKATIYTNDKVALSEVVSRHDERVSATELLTMQRNLIQNRDVSQETVHREESVYGR